MNRRHVLTTIGAGVLTAGLLRGGRSLGLRAQEGTPEASPEATPGGENEVTVDVVDIDFNPNEFTILAATDVTVHLPNKGAAIHNFNIDAKKNPSDPGIHSGDVPPGEETTVTLNLPVGEWNYYCSIPGHEAAGMHGIVHVA